MSEEIVIRAAGLRYLLSAATEGAKPPVSISMANEPLLMTSLYLIGRRRRWLL
jgi:hypothetical protein